MLGFEKCDDQLGSEAGPYLREIADQILSQSGAIVEIQILGHADTTGTKGCNAGPARQFVDNLHLASARADTVFQALQSMKISPVEHA